MNYNNMTMNELRKKAKKRKIKRFSTMNKKQLINKLIKNNLLTN